RVEEWHVAGTVAQGAGWGQARNALLALDPSRVHVVMETSTVLDGDAITPLLAAMDDPTSAAASGRTVVGAGWRGVDVDLSDRWRRFVDAGPGEVDALLGYLAAFDAAAVRAVAGFASAARFYRNADIEMSLALRAAGGTLVVPAEELPVHQARHRGYHDSNPEVRERESRRTYGRILASFRGHPEILAPRP
ncbi:MAG: hypothetical protein ACYCU5_15375, partial [Actinomycetes bacterium]